jgi:hypothetical protein
MGVSLSVCKTFKKEVKTFIRPKVESTIKFDIDDNFPDCIRYFQLVSEVWIHNCAEGEFCEPHYNEKYFENDKKRSQEFFDEVKTLADSPVKQWMLSHEGKFISLNDEHGFWVSNELEIIEREVYVASDPIIVNEDDRLLMNAIQGMKNRYEINLSAFISSDYLNCYLPEVIQSFEEAFKKIDSISIAKEAEEKLKLIVRNEDDLNFDERMPRVKMVIEALKQGGIFIMSV